MALLEILDQQQQRLAYVATFNTKEVEKLPQAYEWTLSFAVPMSDPGYQCIEEFNFVRVGGANGQLFTIRKIEETLAMDGSTIAVVFCEHVSYELLDDYLVDSRAVDSSAGFALQTALTNSPQFTAGTVEPTGIETAYFVQQTPTAALNTIMERWGGEIEFNNRGVSLLDRRGADKGLQIREGKNLKTLKRTVDASSVATRFYGYGKDGITVDTINGGLPYIDSANAPLYKKADGTTRYLIGEIKTDDETPEALLASMQKQLAISEVPLVSYQVELLELKTLPGFELEEHELGDTVTIISPKLANTNIKARIVDYEHDLDYPERSKVTIANFLPNLIQDNLMALEENRAMVEKSIDYWNRARSLNPDGTLPTSFLQGAINALTNQIVASGAYTSAQVLKNQGVLFENTEEASADYGAMYIGPGIFSLANTKDVNGEWVWRTGGTGNGLTADVITAGTILTSLVRIEGDSNFYWDGSAMYCVDPADTLKQIRISKEGIKLTVDGGITWCVGMDYDGVYIGPNTPINGTLASTVVSNASTALSTANAAQTTANNSVQQGTAYNSVVISTTDGVKASHADGSYTKMSGAGLERVVAGVGKPYMYLNYSNTGATVSQSDRTQIPFDVVIQLPTDFIGKDFSITLGMASIQTFTNAGTTVILSVLNIDKPNGRFTARAYQNAYMGSPYFQSYYDGINFMYVAIA